MSPPAPNSPPDDTRARVAALRDRASQGYPEAWIPSREDPEFVGFFRSLDQRPTRNGAALVAVFADAASGIERAVWLVHTALRNEMARQRPRPGELVLIRWEGTREPAAGGRAYEAYRVVVEREGGSLGWDTIAVDDDQAPAPASSQPPAVPDAMAEAEAMTVTSSPCRSCGRADGHHEQSCPEDIPF